MSKTIPSKDLNWEAIHNEYRTGAFSLNELAKKYSANPSTVTQRARKEGWKKDLQKPTADLMKMIVKDNGGDTKGTGLNQSETKGCVRALLSESLPPESPVDAVANVAARQAAAWLSLRARAEKGAPHIDAGYEALEGFALKLKNDWADDPSAHMMYGKMLHDVYRAEGLHQKQVITANRLDSDDRSAGNAPLNITINLRRGQQDGDDDTINITPNKDDK